MPVSSLPTGSFSRREIATLTGIDDSTLNYWMREGILRPASGGAGRGSHRRFAYPEVTLAAVLNELRGFGIGAPSLAHIAGNFHASLDWMAERGVNQANMSRIMDAYLIRQHVVRDGSWRLIVGSRREEAEFADLEIHSDRGMRWVEMSWERAIAHWFRPRPDGRVPDRLTPGELRLLESWETVEQLREFRRHEMYFDAITTIYADVLNDNRGGDAHAFFRDETGDWQLANSPESVVGAVSFICVDIYRLSTRIWWSFIPDDEKRRAEPDSDADDDEDEAR
jgi:hypothetical protein